MEVCGSSAGRSAPGGRQRTEADSERDEWKGKKKKRRRGASELQSEAAVLQFVNEGAERVEKKEEEQG